MKARIALFIFICLAVHCAACKPFRSMGERLDKRLDESLVYPVEEGDLFQPRRTPVRPETFNRRNLEVVLADGNILRGIAIMRAGAEANIIYFGGNADLAQAATLEMTRWTELYNANAIFVDYRGFGASGGAPAVRHLPDDALRVYDQTSELRMGLHTIVVGHSIGSLPATFVAARRPCDGLVLVAPITSFEDQDMYPQGQTRQLMPWYNKPLSWRAKIKPTFEIFEKSEPMQQIQHVTAPLLVIHGEDDLEVPIVCGMKIYSLARGKKTMLLLQGVGHGEISLAEGPGAEGMAKFMAQCLAAN